MSSVSVKKLCLTQIAEETNLNGTYETVVDESSKKNKKKKVFTLQNLIDVHEQYNSRHMTHMSESKLGTNQPKTK